MEQNNATMTESPTPEDDTTELDNVGPKTAQDLADEGIHTVRDVAEASMMMMDGVIGGYTGVGIHNEAKDIVEAHNESEGDNDIEDETEQTTDAEDVAAMHEDATVSIDHENKFVLRTSGQISIQMTNKARELGYVAKSMDANNDTMCVEFKQE